MSDRRKPAGSAILDSQHTLLRSSRAFVPRFQQFASNHFTTGGAEATRSEQRIRRQGAPRGNALLLTLLIASLLMVLGFALADLCTVHLQMARQFQSSSRAALLAQAAAEHFLFVFGQAAQQAQQGSTPLNLGAFYASGNGLPQPQTPSMDGSVTITFDPTRPWFSTDNSASEYAAAGWTDRGTTGRSIPPFTVDLVMTVQCDGETRHYETYVMRRWPYAVFCGYGLIDLSSAKPQSGPTVPTVVNGDIASLYDQTVVTQTVQTWTMSNVTGITALTPSGESFVALSQLPPNTVKVLQRPTGPDPTLQSPVTIGNPAANDTNNAAAGNVFVTAAFGNGDITSSVQPGNYGPNEAVGLVPQNTLSGHVYANRLTSQLSLTSNPITQLPAVDPTAYTLLPPPPITLPKGPAPPLTPPPTGYGSPGSGPGLNLPGKTTGGTTTGPGLPLPAASPSASPSPGDFLMQHDLVLDPDLPDNPPYQYGGGKNRFRIEGNLCNQWVIESSPGVYQLVQPDTRLILNNCQLYVSGLVDLAGSKNGGIQGSNATIYVQGILRLADGQLDASDQGMLIVASEIITQARGTYHGVIMAQDSIVITPPSTYSGAGDGLDIHGAVLSLAQGTRLLSLHGTTVTYDASYLKSLNGNGDPLITMWRDLP